MTKIDWKAELEALDASLPERLERLAMRAETSKTYVQDARPHDASRGRGRHTLRGAGRDQAAQGD
jgi:hypothetical protein